MPYTVQQVQSESDLEEVIALYCVSYETPFNAFYVLTRGDTGPDEHLQRQTKWHKEDPTSCWIKVLDDNTGQAIAAAQWLVRTEGLNPYADGQAPDEIITWWSEGERRRFAERMYAQWGDHRPVKMRKPHLFLNACFVHPDHRGRGAGRMLVQWGVDKADSLGIEMLTEATDEGKPLYAKYDFVLLNTFYLRSEVPNPSPQWKDLEKVVQTPCHAHLMWRPSGGLGGNRESTWASCFDCLIEHEVDLKTISDFVKAVNSVNDAVDDIAKILRISGTPSLSYAVIHHGQVISTQHLGFRDVEAQARPDDDTRHNINSLTKALVVSLVAMEVTKGSLSWSSKVKDHIPGFATSNPLLQQECTIQDLVSHRTGLGRHEMGWSGPLNSLLLDRADALPTFATLKSAGAFRDSFIYNNWCYELVGQILERTTGKPLSQLLHERIFKVLDMRRTSTEWSRPGGNNAKSYTVLDDLSVFEVPPPTMEKGEIMEAAGGVKSSLSDLIRLYQEMLKAFSPNLYSNGGRSHSNVFEDCLDIFGLHNTLPGWSLREQSYGAGWCRAQLPGQLGRISENASLGPQPIVGGGRPSQLVIYHHGSMCGSQTVVNLLPETQSAVIALQNSLGPVDSADFAAELLVERLLGVQSPVDYVQLTRERTAQAFEYMDMLKSKLDSERKLGTMPKPLEAYTGTYWNGIRNWRIDVSPSSDGHLAVLFQGLKSEPFTLRHYNYDTFTWWMPYNDVMRSGQYAIGSTSSFWLMRFEANNFGEVVKLIWAMDTEFPEGEETFTHDLELL
ncbi:hypothetical protein FHL15_000279 [Xylaria flabelliformis]|uniref:N-acetyltransferase domain-containing protein n=1 Tax=Xylaria flabelliformis TaxID=2512241 RepID=A0A553IFG6_9PEZI|nr:hypothetical protein FHL15_000279 [Xylaria flabelliformis]